MKQFAILFAAVCAMTFMTGQEAQAQCGGYGGGFGRGFGGYGVPYRGGYSYGRSYGGFSRGCGY